MLDNDKLKGTVAQATARAAPRPLRRRPRPALESRRLLHHPPARFQAGSPDGASICPSIGRRHRRAPRPRRGGGECASTYPSSRAGAIARLRFYPLSGKTRRGVFGISIPHRAARRHTVAPRWFDLIVVPLVGVDGEGRRLGMGGGFYDRALDFGGAPASLARTSPGRARLRVSARRIGVRAGARRRAWMRLRRARHPALRQSLSDEATP